VAGQESTWWRKCGGSIRERGAAVTASGKLAQAFLACKQDLLRYVRMHVRCPQLSMDIAQETFVRALNTPRGSIREPRAFFFRAARNLSIDHLRYQQVRMELESSTEVHDVASGAPEAEQALHARRQMDVLRLAIEELPPKRREIFLLHRLEGASHAELAQLYGLSRNMIEKHIIASVAHCRLRMDQWENGRHRPAREKSA
jgi:RNA polymerase sigma-70 factor (ECF subfamily)